MSPERSLYKYRKKLEEINDIKISSSYAEIYYFLAKNPDKKYSVLELTKIFPELTKNCIQQRLRILVAKNLIEVIPSKQNRLLKYYKIKEKNNE